MSKCDFEELLQKQFSNDPQKVLAKYNYNSGENIFARIEAFDKSDFAEFKSIINEITLWKINRQVFIDEQGMNALCILKSISSPEEALGTCQAQVKKCLTVLLKTQGAKLAVASAFMHFFNPKVFPIFDQRAYRVIYKGDYKGSASVEKQAELYFDYLKKCIEYYRDVLNEKIPFSELDKYLYQIDKEMGNQTN